ncbi:MAG: aspartate-semialdehyde dehydrogenase [Dehalococcoidia bacterium]|nr:aspartate-semialdehyde dehydrogenase [Dehalococcoidia bacterium]
MKGFNVAILGATGLVGQELVKVLEERKFPVASLELLAAERSGGRRVFVNRTELEVKDATSRSFDRIDIALFTASAEVSRHFAPIAAQAGAVVVDNSAAFRTDTEIPLVVPEINPDDIKSHQGIIASPNAAAVQTVMALYPLHRMNPVKRAVVATYQSVSGSGAAAMEELSTQTRLVMEGRAAVPHVYPHQIAFNLLPEIDVFLDDGYSKEEWNLVQEARRILHAPELPMSATCVRVPVFIGYSVAITVELSRAMNPDDARRILADAPGVKLMDDPYVSLYPQPWSVAGLDDVFVGRVRTDGSHPNGLAMWVVADNLRKGAALNAVQIAEAGIQRGWIPRRK